MIHLLVWSLLHIEFESFLEEEEDERNTSQKLYLQWNLLKMAKISCSRCFSENFPSWVG